MSHGCHIRNFMTFSFASRLARSSFVLLCLLGCGLARGQLSLDREPPGPSSRKTGLVITEIMYHPRPVPGLTNRLQFIEIFNSKPWDEAMGGFSLDGTI